mgnify:CR=1 FL=1
MTDKNDILSLRIPTKENPLRILMSACLAGLTCGYDGTANGEYPSALKLLHYENVKIIKFCPEEFSFGTPREMCDCTISKGSFLKSLPPIQVMTAPFFGLTSSGVKNA